MFNDDTCAPRWLLQKPRSGSGWMQLLQAWVASLLKPAAEKCRSTDVDYLGRTVLHFGKHSGASFVDVLTTDIPYCRWMLKEVSFRRNELSIIFVRLRYL